MSNSPKLVLILLAFAGLFFKVESYAATINVNALIEEPGCDLIEAIHTANNDVEQGGCVRNGADGADLISISEDIAEIKLSEVLESSDVIGETALPHITSEIHIVGQNAGLTRILRDSVKPFRFFVVYGGNLTLENLELQNGSTLPDYNGGAIWVSGDFSSVDLLTSYLTLENTQIIENSAKEGGGLYLYSGSEVIVKRSTFYFNQAIETSSGGDGIGGGIRAEPILDETPISLRIFDSTFISNSAQKSGGGVSFASHQGSRLNVYNSSFFRNEAVLNGGAIFLLVDNDDKLVKPQLSNSALLRNNVIAGNRANRGSEIFLLKDDLENSLTIDNNLIGDNSQVIFEAINVESLPENNNIFATSDSEKPLNIDDILEPGISATPRGIFVKRLAKESPAINTGVPYRSTTTGTFPNMLTTYSPGCTGELVSIGFSAPYRIDQNEAERPIGVECDIGSYESEYGVNDDQCYVVPTSNNKTVVFCI